MNWTGIEIPLRLATHWPRSGIFAPIQRRTTASVIAWKNAIALKNVIARPTPSGPPGVMLRAIPGGAAIARSTPNAQAPRARAAAVLALVAVTTSCAHLPGPPLDISTLTCQHVVPRGAVVRWVTPPDDRNRARLAQWCETVGPVLLQPNPAVVNARAVDRLAVVTWNLHVGGGDLGGLTMRLRRGEFTGGEPIDQFVLLLQEAYRRDIAVPARIPRGYPAPSRIAGRVAERGPDIERFSRENGLAVMYVPSMRNGIDAVDSEDRGNAIVSTLALHDAVAVELPLEHQRRVAAVATVAGQTRSGAPWRLRLANVHLDTALALGHGGPFAARRRQAEILVDALTGYPAIPTVLAGDFNTWRGDGEPALAVLRRAFPETPQMSPGPTWVGPLGIHARLDHMFVRGPVAATRVARLGSRFGSDHFPLLAIVNF
jgi:endonuclease/exonuclease/phosphatase family metal-dependent hydrolase